MNKLQWKFNQDTKLFINENATENIVGEMAAILSTGRWVKLTKDVPYRSAMGCVLWGFEIMAVLTLYVLNFRGNINIYLHFVSFQHIDMALVVEILPQIRQEATYSI